jgi:hypothetical protein
MHETKKRFYDGHSSPAEPLGRAGEFPHYRAQSFGCLPAWPDRKKGAIPAASWGTGCRTMRNRLQTDESRSRLDGNFRVRQIGFISVTRNAASLL